MSQNPTVSSSFRKIVVVVVIAIAIVPVILTAIPALTYITQLTLINARRELSLIGTSRTKELTTQIDLLAVQMQTIGRDSDVRRSVRSLLFLGRADLRLGELVDNNPLVESVYLIDEKQKIVTVAPEQMHGKKIDIANFVQSLQQGDSHKSVIQNYTDHDDSGLVVITPITGIVGRSDGHLLAFITTQKILEQANVGLPDTVSAQFRVEAATPPDSELLLTYVEPLNLGQFETPSIANVVFTEPKRDRFIGVYQAFYAMTFVLLVLVALLLGVGVFLGRFLTRPLEQLTSQAASYSSGRYDAAKPDLKFREFDEVAQTLAKMASRVAINIEIEKTKAQAELQALRSQMTPHFLFNALNGLITMIDVEPTKAAKILGKLADLYRLTLEASKSAMGSLEDELEIVRLYLELECLRFGKRLTFSFDCENVASDSIFLPTLLLQTLAENAVKHGVAKARQGGYISIQVKPVDDSLYEISIVNTGKPYGEESQSTRSGTGITNSIKRLDLIYGMRHRFAIGINDQGATQVRFYISGKEKTEAES